MNLYHEILKSKVKKRRGVRELRACATETIIARSFDNPELRLRLCNDEKLCLCDNKRYGCSERKYDFRVTTGREGFCSSGIISRIIWSSTFVSSLLIVFLCVEVGIVWINRVFVYGIVENI